MIQLPSSVWNKIKLYNSHPCADIIKPLISKTAVRMQRERMLLMLLSNDSLEAKPEAEWKKRMRSFEVSMRRIDVKEHDKLFVRMHTKKTSRL